MHIRHVFRTARARTSIRTLRWGWNIVFVAAAPCAIRNTPAVDINFTCSWKEPCDVTNVYGIA